MWLAENHMAEQPHLPNPKIEWKDGKFLVSLPMQGGVIDAKWRPTVTFVVRIGEPGTELWSPGFETPLNGCSFVGLQPNTEYEIMVAHKSTAGEGPPTKLRCKSSRSPRSDAPTLRGGRSIPLEYPGCKDLPELAANEFARV